jgi:hypothetical protein
MNTANQLIEFLKQHAEIKPCGEGKLWVWARGEEATLRDFLIALPFEQRVWLSSVVHTVVVDYAHDLELWDAARANWQGLWRQQHDLFIKKHLMTWSKEYELDCAALWEAWKPQFWDAYGAQIEALIERGLHG